MANKININELDWTELNCGNFSSYRKSLGQAAGGEMLGTSLFKLLPGNKAFPYHCHYANEEAILVLEGEGTLRLGDEKTLIKQQDYIALPKGESHAHQVINTSDQPLVYLCFSTMIEPEVMSYPDSDKVGLMTGSAPGGKKQSKSIKAFFQNDSNVPYEQNED